ncbi:helix-turn-helix domain-containing protein [Streptosporangium roseum]|uniref:Transposase n=1 Tax=Streptosporangium roseum (strain ATCC 12428 / DSM 43021 / JCM 3005 / KCTC 9067 / NCIMB 10171 / NRRL 2505 / NI 9100) TaxID=479432 RepID=D2AZ92_STRRD|nr:helix-turn-helix domain-containing protein [Streptosporangium roseum]ACZ83277.1 putative transposase [Streptosporangium roseum DSM 43021]ACZ87825.1 putative transposase [Streptosporangium roseum DSM 43021]ACZ89355.1 putative transposase [Streptosporangium roseum DSM 43021]
MPKLLYARPPADAEEERQIRKLAGARHAPADWITRAQMIAFSWQGQRTSAIAARLGCHMQTVRERIERFNAEGLAGLGDRPGAGRKPRLTEIERGCVIALARSAPPGRPVREGAGDLVADDESGPAQWTLDSLTAAARAQGIVIARSQVRRILLTEKVRWRHTRSWSESTDPQFTPKGPKSSASTPTRRPAPR